MAVLEKLQRELEDIDKVIERKLWHPPDAEGLKRMKAHAISIRETDVANLKKKLGIDQ